MATKSILDELDMEYAGALGDYVARGGEAALEQAYEVGRRALSEKLAILDMVAIHHRVLAALLRRSATREENIQLVAKAGEFLAESLSPFEMTHRAFMEANLALSRLNEILEEENKRIAHALHDEAGQLLAAVHISLEDLARGLPPSARERLQGVRKLLDQIEEQLRHLSHELRPTILDDLGIVPALEFLAEGVSKRTKQHITVEAFKGERLPAPVETALYRIVQEGLHNVTKHAKATEVKIRIERTDGQVICSVRDNGVGFDSSGLPSRSDEQGLGLIGMRERLNALGGTFEIRTGPGSGTDLEIKVPLER
ncbi:MAG: hypothetical protein DMG25_04410 [Acidobacteria bacterium]|nr:MAG: hypothetical protein DMG25_04410 [Acidobacteriota bacterium]PYV28802.1 MAG: hypothetical protein DMG27_00240 [Acidobacteriota bacterium]